MSTTIQDRFRQCLTEKQSFSADGQNTGQNYTIVIMLSWSAISSPLSQKSQFVVRKLRLKLDKKRNIEVGEW